MPLASRAVRFRRVGRAGVYRVFPLAGQPNVFVQRFSEPSGLRSSRDRPHGEYTGRMIRFSSARGGYGGVAAYLEHRLGTPVGRDAWLLIEGERPGQQPALLLLYGLLAAFFVFNGVGLYRILRPVRD